ncbi:molybdate ABC transporter substrate-binding protein [Caldichromatium japonicum]|uniref:Molybdate ABC transporter substrate-binding protein n=1 Tax=Caldichromatium japonicum TaxID=2699430 RepID=A0A6G7VF43_9GAMM|nr:molybdate ABC transporter substrate-binding protein [Caldichromatium japonicum]QIK38572.1 molybdate ABC transporter substrate-binding protein [Caldichromatium japonicum]
MKFATLIAALSFSACALADEVQVAVAANFSAPMKIIAADFEKDTGHKAQLAFGTAGKFFAQIKAGAPFDVLVSSDKDTPDKLVAEGLAVESTRRTYAIGKLVLWSARPDVVDAKGEVLRKGDFKHLALANPKLAVYGAAGQEAMKRMGVLEAIQPRIVLAENITQTYQFVASGNAELGFVALSQVIGKEGRISEGSYWMVPAELYPQIRQDAIVLNLGRDKPAAKALVDYLKTPKARAVIKAYGYDLD